MKFFITGGTGFIGEGLINRLLNEGKEVVALCRSDKGLMEKEGLAWKKGSLEDADSLIRAMEGCTHVFHCAGLARLWDPDTEAFFRVNVKGTENILAAASYHDIEKL
ncbi:MAG TPA: NAD-dependent epimerase/dehydratase family protein, partial [Phnomibacter sp.]|nr:NAD-dependent epimerase/dehydratase family protein [Phnomibacter sp.]